MKPAAIRVLRGCGASGRSLVAGTVYAVPGDVSEADALLLVQLGKAEPSSTAPQADDDAPKQKRARKAE
jgi:hypothetical protein